MPTSFPGALDTTTNLPVTRVTGDAQGPTNHINDHNNVNAAVVAVETKLGIGASTPTNGAVPLGSATAGTSAWVTGSAGNTLRRGAAGFVASGREFSATAYGVVGDNNNATAGANTTALDACIAAAVAAGEGSAVLLDWTGTAYLNGGHKLYSRIAYIGTGFNKSKLANSRPTDTNVYETATFQTLTQTRQPTYSVGEYEWVFINHMIDGNVSNNASGGCGIAAVGYGYFMDMLTIEYCAQAGWWSEWTLLTEPINVSLGSRHERGFGVGQLWFYNNECDPRPAANTRSSEGRAAVETGQVTLFGPGDSNIQAMHIGRGGVGVTGMALKFGAMDFTAGTVTNFDLTIDRLTVWGNHQVGIDAIGNNLYCSYLHLEGGYVNLRINTAGGPKIARGKCFNARPTAGTATANTTSASASVTNLSTTTNVNAGMWVTGSGIPSGTYILAVSGTTITLSANATATATGVTISFWGTEIAVISSGNHADITLQMLDNANSGVQSCKLACLSSHLVHGRLWLNGQVGGTETLLLAAGSRPNNAKELDISYDDFSGGAATITTGWIDGPLSIPSSLSSAIYRLHYVVQPETRPTSTATAAAGAATANASAGTITSEALTTAAGADYSLVITNALVKATSHVFASVDNFTNTTEGIAVTRITPASGSFTIRVRNTHAATALNGSIKVNFMVVN